METCLLHLRIGERGRRTPRRESEAALEARRQQVYRTTARNFDREIFPFIASLLVIYLHLFNHCERERWRTVSGLEFQLSVS